MPDELPAEVADHYVTALRNRKPTTKYIQENMGPFVPVGNWVKKARYRGFLTAAPKKGQRGGRLTPKTRAVLKRKKDSNEESQ